MIDDDGYPTERALKRVASWPIKSRRDATELLAFVESLWAYPEYFRAPSGRGRLYHVSTAGWSGNESLIDALGRNFIFWSLAFYKHQRGGHYVFDLGRFPKAALHPVAKRGAP